MSLRPFQYQVRKKRRISTDYPSIASVLSENALTRSRTLPDFSRPEIPTQERPGWLPGIRSQENPPPQGFTPLQWELVQASGDGTLPAVRAPRIPRPGQPVSPATYLFPRPYVSEMIRGVFGVPNRPQSRVRRNSVGTYSGPLASTQPATDSGASEGNATPRPRKRDALEGLSAELVRGIKAVTKDM